jgi:hypothetical protein
MMIQIDALGTRRSGRRFFVRAHNLFVRMVRA